MISNQAYIHPDAKLGKNVTVEPFAYIAGDVVIGDDCWIGPGAVIHDGARIGKGCKIHTAASIACTPQDLKFVGEKTTAEIGDYNEIREYVTISRGTASRGKTVVGSHNLIMAYVHIAHDDVVGSHCVMANRVSLAGEVEVGDWAVIGGHVAVHQWTRIGEHTMIQGGALVGKDIPPFITVSNDPVRFACVNRVGLSRRGFTAEMIGQIHDLKLQIYEEKLNQAYAELQYLTLQIKPHFFLNCLNLIYSLGLSGRSELVVDFSATLMKYFRYLFKSSDSMVVLSEELKHVQNYLHIQQIRFQNDLDTDFKIDPQAEKMQIPVLTLHTFVENIFKHGCSDSAKMQIIIHAAPVIKDGKLYLSLCIEDNGIGFSKESLEKLSKPEVPSQKTGEKHIGIRNVRQRLSYIYGSNYVLRFENRSQGGAKINLLLPQNGKFHVSSA